MRKSQASQRLSQPSQRLSQASQGTPRSQPPPMATGELKEAARAAVRYLLMNDFDKVPIKHNEIVRNVTKNVSRNTNQVLELAGKMLYETYGIKLVDYVNSASNRQYLLINALKHQDHIAFSSEVKSDMTLLAILLSLIFMLTNGRQDAGIEQQKVHSFLKLLDIDVTEVHDYFGDMRKVLERLKSQRYIELLKIDNTDPVKYEYRWGMRACEELSPREALEFASEMYGRDKIDSWAAQYKVVCEHERALGQ